MLEESRNFSVKGCSGLFWRKRNNWSKGKGNFIDLDLTKPINPSHHPEWLSASGLPGELIPVSTERDSRWMCQGALGRTPRSWEGSSGSPGLWLKARKPWTWACWVRRHVLSSEEPLLQCSPGLPTRPGPPQSRDQAPTPVWSCSHVQSWHAWVCVYFCSQECPEQEPAFVDSSVVSEGFPGGASGKEPACQCRRHKKCRFDPWVRKLPWRRALHPTAVFLPGESHGQRSLAGYSPWGHTESDTTEAT